MICRHPPLLVLLALLLALPLSTAAETVHTGWHFSGDTFAVGDTEISVSQPDDSQLSEGRDKVLLTVDDTLYVLGYGDCEQTPYYRYCYTESGYTDHYGSEEKPYVTYDGGKKWWGFYLRIDSLLPDVGATLEADETSLEIEEQNEIVITLSNDGETYAQNAIFTLAIPHAYTIGPTDLLAPNNTIRWEGKIGPSREQTLRIKLTPQRYEDATLKGLLNYTYEGEAYSIESDGLTLRVPQPYTFTSSLDAGPHPIHQEVLHEIEITNEESTKDLTIDSLLITVPLNIHLMDYDKTYTYSNNQLRWSGTLKPGKTKRLTHWIAAPFTGEYPYQALAQLEVDGRSFTEEHNHTFTVKTEELNADFHLQEKSVKSREPFNLYLFLENANEQNNYYNVSVLIKSDAYDGESFTIESIPYQDAVEAWHKEFIAPFTEQARTITFNVTGSYTTISGEPGSYFTSETISVAPADERYFAVTYDAPDEVVAGEDYTVRVTITNQRDQYVVAEASDDHPGPRILGADTASISLEGGEQRQAYSYKARLPAGFSDEQFMIRTEVRDPVSGTIETSNITILAIPYQPPADNATTNESDVADDANVSDAAPDEIVAQPDERPSISERLVGMIKRFFALFT